LNGRVCRGDGNDSPARTSTVVHVTPSSEPSSSHVVGAGAAAPRIRVPQALKVTRTAFIPIWRKPWMSLAADTYGASVLQHLGVRNAFADADERYPALELAEAIARRPDLVIAPDEPYPFGPRQQEELEAVAPVRFVDGRDLFWWGTRTPGALERLAAALA